MTAPATPPLPLPFPQRGIQGFLTAVFAGAMAAAICVLSLTLGSDTPFFAGFFLLTPVPLLLAGLGVGRGDALVAALVCGAILMLTLNQAVAQAVTAIYILPVLLLCLLALRYRYDEHGDLYWYPTGWILTALVLYPIAVLALFSFFIPEGNLEGVLNDFIAQAIDIAMQTKAQQTGLASGMPIDNPEFKAALQHMMVAILPGMTITTWILLILTAAIWSQYALANNRLALRPVPHWTDLELPSWLLVLLAIMGLVGIFFQGPIAYFARNTLLPLSLPYFFVGIALVHVWARQKQHKLLWLLAFYLIVGFGWPAILVATAGVLEPWLHLRNRVTTHRK